MKKVQFYFLGLMMLVIAAPAFGQVVSKNQPKTSGDAKSVKEAQLPVDFSTSREEDIYVFENNMKMFQNAIDVKSSTEAEVFLNKNLEITRREIARAKNNLAELKAGNTKHLDEWRKENGESDPLNIALEINRLNDNINSMEYRYKDLKKANISNFSDSRASATWLGDMRIILKNMNKNLKYESDKKIIHVEQPAANDTVNVQGSGIITQNDPGQEDSNDNPEMAIFKESQAARISQFKQEKTNFEDYLQNNDYKLAKRTYKTLLQLMQEEIDANNWLKIQQDELSSKMATINLDTISPRIAQQQKIAAEASEIKIPGSENNDFLPSKPIELLSEFEQTFQQ